MRSLVRPAEAIATSDLACEDDTILVTGANGFIGARVVRLLVSRGFTRVRCLTRSPQHSAPFADVVAEQNVNGHRLELITGNLLSRRTCEVAMDRVSVVYHLAAGVEKSFPGCFLNSVVSTRNLLDAALDTPSLKRFVNIGSLAVYSNEKLRRGAVIDETSDIDGRLVERHDAYAYGKAKQDELVLRYGARGLPYVLVRPGITFGPGKAKIPGRVGIDTFGIFLHLGLGNIMPLTYVDNCAEAIILAGLTSGIDGEVINIVDDDLPRSREFLREYKRHVRRFASLPVPYPVFYMFNSLWERYSHWSEGQLPPVFNRRTCAAYFKGNAYSNQRAKDLLGWSPRVPMSEALQRFFRWARARDGRT
jgi:nucleoside-diphosphate-sugar epimerase